MSAWPVALVGLVALIWLTGQAPTSRAAALRGWLGGAAYFAGGMFWIVEPFLVDPVKYGWMAPFALVLLPSGLALFWGAAFGLAHRWSSGWRRPFLAAALLTLAEVLRTFLLTGFPWGLLGYLWIGAPQMQAAAVVGPHGLTLATALLGAAGSVWIGRRRIWLIAPALALAWVVAVGLWGAARRDAGSPPETGVTVRIVQPNAEQHLKWDPGRAGQYLDLLLLETAAAPKGPVPDLVIWPETAVQYLLNGSDGMLAAIDEAAGGRPVAFGIVRAEGPRYFNSLVVTAPGGGIASVYDKHYLTPFGEFVPFGELLGRFGIHGMAASAGEAFSPGPGPKVVDFGKAGRGLPLICYEAIFPQNLFAGERPDFLIQITNDAWFGKISGPYQHLAQARLRAVEQGLPMLRAANTGVSAVIDARGRVLAELGLGQEGRLDAVLPPPLAPTPYARTGDWPAFAALAFLVLALSLPRRKSH